MRRIYWKQLLAIGCLAIWALTLGTGQSFAQSDPQVFDNGTDFTATTSIGSDDSVSAIQADDVVLPSTTLVTEIRWSGTYGVDPNGPATDDFSIEIYADASGFPTESPLATFNVGNNVNRTTPSVGRFEYSADIDFTMQAGVTYWITIHDQNDDPLVFAWSSTPGPGNGVGSNNGGTTWFFDDNAHQLHITLFGQVAESLTWNNTTGSPNPWFDVAGNWDPNSTPNAADSVFFSEAATYEVHWDNVTGDRAVESLGVFAGDVTFLNQPDNSTRYNLDVTTNISLLGALTIEGINLDVQQTALIAGTLTVDGSAVAGSSVFSGDLLGVFGGGTMNINNGGVVTTSGDGLVADAVIPGDGTVNIDGAGSEWNIAGELRAGINGEGDVNVTGGGLLTSNGGVIGDGISSVVRIEGAGSQWINTGSLTMQKGLTIDNGATVSVTGPIQNESAIISIGGSGGTLIAPAGITNNRIISISGTTSVIQGSITNNDSISTLLDDTLTITGDLTHSAARLNSGLLSAGSTRIEGSYNGGGFVASDNAGVVIVAGDYLPADVTGPETGFVQFEGASLQMESTTTTFIDLAAANDHDQISAVTFSDTDFYGITFFVHSNVSLAGDLQVNLLNGFTLDAGQTFEIVDFASDGTLSGSFANFAEGDVVLSDNGFDLVISYVGGDGDDVVLTTVLSPSNPPANDAFASSIGSLAFPFDLTGTNIGATVEPGEQQLGNTGATVWYFFNAPEDGMVTIDTFGSDFDTQLHIFDGFSNGATVADLNPVVNNDDTGGTSQSEVTFAVTEGACYEIRVGGFAFTDGLPTEGNITLGGTFEPLGGPVELFPESFNVFRGLQVGSGTVADVQASDDVRLQFNPGFTLNSSEAPVWIEFASTLDVGEDYEVNVETQANTPGLTYTVESRNYPAGGGYEVIGSIAESFNNDSVVTFALTPDHVDINGETELRVGWRQTGFTLLFPWAARVDAISWTPDGL